MTSDDVFTDRLSDYLDDEELDRAERASIAAHVAACEACRTTLDELRAVRARASSLEDIAPEANLWPGIASRLDDTRRVLPFAAGQPRRFSFTLPQLVAAGLALMVLSGGMVWMSRLDDPRTNLPPVVAQVEPPDERALQVNFADAHYDEAIADLEKALADNRSRLDPETVRILEENLLAIDVAIAQSRKALRADPANVYLNNHFAEFRNRKLALLRRASALAMASGDSSGS
jgi:anti-sigma factor RsiW